VTLTAAGWGFGAAGQDLFDPVNVLTRGLERQVLLVILFGGCIVSGVLEREAAMDEELVIGGVEFKGPAKCRGSVRVAFGIVQCETIVEFYLRGWHAKKRGILLDGGLVLVECIAHAARIVKRGSKILTSLRIHRLELDRLVVFGDCFQAFLVRCGR